MERKGLAWSDFKSTPPDDNGATAITAREITYTYTTTTYSKNGSTTLNYVVTTYFAQIGPGIE